MLKDADTEGSISVLEEMGGYEELKEALLRQKVKENWIEKHRNVARKIFLEGGWTEKETIRHWLVGNQSMSSLPEGGRHRKAQALPLPRMERGQT